MTSARADDGKRYVARPADPSEIRPQTDAYFGRTDGHVELILRQSGPNLRADFFVDLGMVCTHLGGADGSFLALPRELDAYVAGAATGMPLLHPYANRLSADEFDAYGAHFDARDTPHDRHGLPIHGTMFDRPFTVEGLSVRDRRAGAITTAAYAAPELLRAFPFAHTVRLMVFLDGPTLRVTTEVHNDGDRPMPVSFGWHPFFTLPSRPLADWVLRLPACRRHVLDDRLLPTGETVDQPEDRSPIGDRTYDDHFDLGADRTFEISADARTLRVDFDEHYPHAQIYLPGPDALLTGDFVCIEPMVANTNALVTESAPTVRPGEDFAATFSVTVM